MTMKLFDPKCFELAESFLSDSAVLRDVPGKANELAGEIQQCIEDWMQGEEAARPCVASGNPGWCDTHRCFRSTCQEAGRWPVEGVRK